MSVVNIAAMIAIEVISKLAPTFIAGLAMFWRKAVEVIKKAVNKIKEVLGVVVRGTRTFIMRTLEGFKSRAKYYNENKLTGEWEETVYTKNVDDSEIPPEILAKVRYQEVDMEVSTTEELRLVISA